jgi:FlaA1/EpsC-like NDP-sugar epimerase
MLLRIIVSQVVFPHVLLVGLPYKVRKVFSVSSDKAANPANLMGASKAVMEEMLLVHADRHPVSSARFANVAFSDGSLPFGFLRRMEKRQPLSAPDDITRYFISHREAGELCLLSAGLADNGEILYPKMEEAHHATSFSDIAVRLLQDRGYEPVRCVTEDEAKRRAGELIPMKKWPCYFFRSDTTGEKDIEEFFCESDQLDLSRFENIGVIRRPPRKASRETVVAFLDFVQKMKRDPEVVKGQIVDAFRRIVPGLVHVETGKNLDQKM